MKFSIKTKLSLIALLFFVSLSVTELFSSYINREIVETNNELTLRQSQVILLKDFKITFADFTIAAMDVILDRDSGVVSPELTKKLHYDQQLLREMLPLFEDLADNAEEKKLSKDLSSFYLELEDIIFNKLYLLISSKASKSEFEELDEAIDESIDKIGESVELFVASIDKEYNETLAHMHETMSQSSFFRRVFACVMLAIAGGTLYILGRGIILPVLSVRDMIQDIAKGEGDLTKRLPEGNDEIGELSAWFNLFIEKLHTIIRQIQSNLSTLNTSAESLSSLSQRLASGSDGAYNRSSSVALAADELSSNITTIAAASEQASTNMNMVASAIEEMNATVKEIAGNTVQARQVTEQAVVKTNATSSRMDKLGGAAQEISKVTESITEISEQTNLLALNATIEAARAGEAGKGFAVVANEIKELAKQTAEATLEIREKILAIQTSTDVTVSEMSDINTVINEVNNIVATIATSVDEQSTSTNEIATNVSQAAQGISEVSKNVSSSSTVSEGIAEEIGGVTHIADSLKNDGDAVDMQLNELINLSNQLDKIVGQFKL
jgi:methyl-accepting chemotaxis protein